MKQKKQKKTSKPILMFKLYKTYLFQLGISSFLNQQMTSVLFLEKS